VWWPVRSGRTAPGRLDVAGLTLLVVESFSFAGHAGQGDLVPFTATADAAHLLAASIWIGGLVVLAAAWVPVAVAGWTPRAGRTLLLWSRTAAAAVAVIVVTGALQAWRDVDAWPALWSTTYGRLLLGKTAVLLAVLALAAASRRWARILAATAEDPLGPGHPGDRGGAHDDVPALEPVLLPGRTPATLAEAHPAPAWAPPSASPPSDGRSWPAAPPVRGPTPARLRASVTVEAALLAGVLALTAVLVDSVPAVQAYAPSFTATVPGVDADGNTVSVHVTVSPVRAGIETVDVEAHRAGGDAVPLSEVDGTLTARALGLGPITFSALPTSPSHARATAVPVPVPGVWTAVLQVRSGPFTDYAATITYSVG